MCSADDFPVRIPERHPHARALVVARGHGDLALDGLLGELQRVVALHPAVPAAVVALFAREQLHYVVRGNARNRVLEFLHVDRLDLHGACADWRQVASVGCILNRRKRVQELERAPVLRLERTPLVERQPGLDDYNDVRPAKGVVVDPDFEAAAVPVRPRHGEVLRGRLEADEVARLSHVGRVVELEPHLAVELVAAEIGHGRLWVSLLLRRRFGGASRNGLLRTGDSSFILHRGLLRNSKRLPIRQHIGVEIAKYLQFRSSQSELDRQAIQIVPFLHDISREAILGIFH